MSVDVQNLLTVLISALGGGTLATIFKQVWDWATGRATRKRDEVDRAMAERDREARHRRALEEHASMLRRIIIGADCLSPDILPDWPRPPREVTGRITTKENDND